MYGVVADAVAVPLLCCSGPKASRRATSRSRGDRRPSTSCAAARSPCWLRCQVHQVRTTMSPWPVMNTMGNSRPMADCCRCSSSPLMRGAGVCPAAGSSPAARGRAGIQKILGLRVAYRRNPSPSTMNRVERQNYRPPHGRQEGVQSCARSWGRGRRVAVVPTGAQRSNTIPGSPRCQPGAPVARHHGFRQYRGNGCAPGPGRRGGWCRRARTAVRAPPHPGGALVFPRQSQAVSLGLDGDGDGASPAPQRGGRPVHSSAG